MVVRKDKIKNKAEAVKALAKNPALTERQLAKEINTSKTTAHNHLKDIDQNWPESNIMDKILEMDEEIINLVNWLHLETIKEKIKNNEKLTLQDHKLLWDLANNSTKRKAIFWDKKKWDDKVTFILG